MTWIDLADPHDDFHVVLDEQDRDLELVAQPADEAHQVERLLRVHAGGGFVEQQQLRPGRQRARDLQPALAAVGQARRGLAGDAIEVEDLQQLHRLFGGLAFLAMVAAGAEHRVGEHLVAAQMMRGQDVLEDGHVGEEPNVLKRPRDAELRDLIRLLAVDAHAVENDFAFGRVVRPVSRLKTVVLPAPFGPISP